MAHFCRLFRLRPADYWALTHEEDSALDAYLEAELAARKKAAAAAKKRKG